MKIIGHRGVRGKVSENTITAFKAAVDAGADGIEFDVRVTKDNIPVLIHDEKRTINNQKVLVCNLTFQELKSNFGEIVKLIDALKYLQSLSDKILIMEIKPLQPILPIIQIINNYNKIIPNLYIASFDFRILKSIKNSLPTVKLIVNEPWSGIRASRCARQLQTPYLNMNQRWLWGGFIKSMTKNGFYLFAYTINNPGQARRYKRAGLYGCVTDAPDRINKE